MVGDGIPNQRQSNFPRNLQKFIFWIKTWNVRLLPSRSFKIPSRMISARCAVHRGKRCGMIVVFMVDACRWLLTCKNIEHFIEILSKMLADLREAIPRLFSFASFFLQLVRWRSLDFKLSVSSSSSSTSSFSPPLRRSRVHADPAQSPRSADSWWQWGSSSWNSWSASSWQRRDWQGAVGPWVGGQGVQYIQILDVEEVCVSFFVTGCC